MKHPLQHCQASDIVLHQYVCCRCGGGGGVSPLDSASGSHASFAALPPPCLPALRPADLTVQQGDYNTADAVGTAQNAMMHHEASLHKANQIGRGFYHLHPGISMWRALYQAWVVLGVGWGLQRADSMTWSACLAPLILLLARASLSASWCTPSLGLAGVSGWGPCCCTGPWQGLTAAPALRRALLVNQPDAFLLHPASCLEP